MSLAIRALISLTLCLGLGVGLWMAGRPPPPAAPTTAPEMATIPEAAPPSRDPHGFPLGAARRLEKLVLQVEVVRLGEGLGTLRDPDPRGYGQRLRSLPEYQELVAWLTPAGDPPTLTAAHRERLAAVDEGFRNEGLLPPFEAFLEVGPAESGGVLSQLEGGEAFRKVQRAALGPDGLPVGPWGRAAGEAMLEVRRLEQEFARRIHDRPQDLLLSGPAGRAGVVGLLAAGVQLPGILRERSARVRFGNLARPTVRAMRRAMLLGGRSLQHEEHADRLACVWSRVMVMTSVGFLTELSDLTPAELFGREPETPAEALFAGWTMREQSFSDEVLEGDLRPRLRRAVPFLRRAMVEPERGQRSRGTDQRTYMARWLLTESLLRLRDVEALSSLVIQYEGFLRRNPGRFGWEGLEKLLLYQVGHERRGEEGLGGRARRILGKAADRLVEIAAERPRAVKRKCLRPARELREIRGSAAASGEPVSSP